jgi:hypothetical protein
MGIQQLNGLNKIKRHNMTLETPEEAACNYFGYSYELWLSLHSKDKSSIIFLEVTNWVKGVKWQQETMCGKEDLVQLLDFVSKEYNISNGIGWFHSHDSIEDISSKEVLKKWFEQFKKKG